MINNNPSNSNLINKINSFASAITVTKKSVELKFCEDNDKMRTDICVKIQTRNKKSKILDDASSTIINKTNEQKFDNLTSLIKKHDISNLKIETPIKQKYIHSDIKNENFELNNNVINDKTKQIIIKERFLGIKSKYENDLTSIFPNKIDQNSDEESSNNEENIEEKKEQFIGFKKKKNIIASTNFMESIYFLNFKIF